MMSDSKYKAIDQIIEGIKIKTWDAYSEAFRTAKGENETEDSKVLRLIAQLFSMYFTHGDKEPFGPMMVTKEGNRTFLPQDLTDENKAILESFINEVEDPFLTARVCDALWLKFRDRKHASKAAESYVQAFMADEDDTWVPKYDSLKRALNIVKSLSDKDAAKEIKDKLCSTLDDALKNYHDKNMQFWPLKVIRLLFEADDEIDKVDMINRCMGIGEDFLGQGRYYEAEKYGEMAKVIARKVSRDELVRCALFEAKAYEMSADKAVKMKNNLKASYDIQNAMRVVAEINDKARLVALEKKLNTVNVAVAGDMVSHEISVDMTPVVEKVKSLMAGKEGDEALMQFALITRPSPYDQVKENVKKIADDCPVSTIMEAQVQADDGRIVYKRPSRLEEPELFEKIEIIRTYMQYQEVGGASAFSMGRKCLQELPSEAIDEALKKLIENSVFVPPGKEEVFYRGIRAGIQSDSMVFMYLIVPQFENSIRYLFQVYGYKHLQTAADGTQKVKHLNNMMSDSAAEEIFGKDMLWEIKALISEPYGQHLRFDICHGVAKDSDLTSTRANCLLWLVIHLLYKFETADEESKDS